MSSVLLDATRPYRSIETWGYDRAIAPAVAELVTPMLDRLLARLPQGGALLDVGAGGGQLACAIATRRPDARVTGLDLSPAQVARARVRARPFGARVEFVEGSALALPFTLGRFDAVVSVASIKHWPDPARGASEMARVAKAGGALAIAEVDRGCRWGDAARFVARWRIPAVARMPALVAFRAFVAGQAIDLDDARALAAGLGDRLGDVEISRVDGTPALMMIATRR
jgi:ubiquinone/menaquinone biosynthesis C-methylase UbiE